MIKALSQIILSVCLSVAVILGLVHTMPKAHADFSWQREATYQIIGDNGTCSGVLIAPKRMLTAKHCQGLENPTVEGNLISIIKVSETADVMVLEVPLDCPCVPVASSNAPVDTKVIVIGYPLGRAQFVTEGRIQTYIEEGVWFSAPIIFGNSGGPIMALVDGEYKVVGIAVAIAADAIQGMFPYVVPHMALGVTVDQIKEVLE